MVKKAEIYRKQNLKKRVFSETRIICLTYDLIYSYLRYTEILMASGFQGRKLSDIKTKELKNGKQLNFFKWKTTSKNNLKLLNYFVIK
jgi:hypothetical protein